MTTYSTVSRAELLELVERWRTRAAQFRRAAAEREATELEWAADELDIALERANRARPRR